MRVPWWGCAICNKRFASLAAWKGHVKGRPTDCPGSEEEKAPAITEADVRRIVREELARHYANQPSGDNP